jgi:hypothetical protein
MTSGDGMNGAISTARAALRPVPHHTTSAIIVVRRGILGVISAPRATRCAAHTMRHVWLERLEEDLAPQYPTLGAERRQACKTC